MLWASLQAHELDLLQPAQTISGCGFEIAGDLWLYGTLFSFPFVNSASNFGVAPRSSISKVKLFNRRMHMLCDRKNRKELIEGKMGSFTGPEDNLFSIVTHSSGAVTEASISLRRWDWHGPAGTFINSSKHCQTLFQLHRILEEVELLTTHLFAFFEIIFESVASEAF